MFLEIDHITKSFGEGENKTRVLSDVSTFLEEGKMCVILGPSGSGKSTLLNLVGGLDAVDSGHIRVDGLDIAGLDNKELSLYRRKYLGYIFQFYNLIPNLTVRENIQVCEYLTKQPLPIDELLNTLGMAEHQTKYPSQLSGGQQQRCAIARALIKNPKLLLCDEPTGALDSITSRDILSLLEEVNDKYKTTMLIVTHNTAIKEMVHHVLQIKDGGIRKDYENENRISAYEIEW